MSVQLQETTGRWGSLDFLLFGTQPARGSGFFGEGQYETIRSETVEPAGATGWTFRPTVPENPSMNESEAWSNVGWIGSPYQDDKAIPVKIAEGKAVAASVEPRKDWLGESLDWALDQTTKAATLYSQYQAAFSPREVISETPRAGYPEGRDVRNTNSIEARSADVYEAGKQFYDQLKGLFNLGYSQSPQPVSTVPTTAKPTIGLGTIAGLGLLLLVRGK